MSLPEPFLTILSSIAPKGREAYLRAMLRHALECEQEHDESGTAVIQLGVSGKRTIERMPNYKIMYKRRDGQILPYHDYSYVDNLEDIASNSANWTLENITTSELSTLMDAEGLMDSIQT